MSFKVINPGIFTLIQDKGRFSYSHLGVTNSGFMDEYAALACHKLLKNSLDENILEISFKDVIFEALKDTVISITGAKCDFFINDKLFKTWQTFNVKKGDIIKIGKFNSGQKVYFAVKNGFKLKKEFSSFSTTLKEDFGKKLSKNDILEYDEFKSKIDKKWHRKYIPNYEKNLTLRVVLSYQEEMFPKEQKEKFFKNSYEITPDFNRMACKLKGEKIECKVDGIISEAIAFGSIQIPKDGQPIILLKEAQTIGGYPKIGSVLSIDCFKLSQMKIGSKIRFEEIDIKEAQNKLKKFYSSF